MIRINQYTNITARETPNTNKRAKNTPKKFRYVVGNAITQFRYYFLTSTFSIILGATESMLFKCLMIFSWKKYAMVNDEFFATFLNIFNFMMGQIISLVRFFIGDFFYHDGFQMFSGYCTNPKIEKM